MNMNQKGFANIILVVVVVMLVGIVGYFVFVKKSEPIAQQLTPSQTDTFGRWQFKSMPSSTI